MAGDGTGGYAGDGGPATSAELDNSSGVALDRVDDLFVVDQGNDVIRKVSANPTLPTTAVGATSASQNVLVQLTSASAISSISVPKAQNGAQEFSLARSQAALPMEPPSIPSTPSAPFPLPSIRNIPAFVPER